MLKNDNQCQPSINSISEKVDVEPEEMKKEGTIATLGKEAPSVVEEKGRKHQKKTSWVARLKLAG